MACCINTWQPSICRDPRCQWSNFLLLHSSRVRAIRKNQLAVLKSALCRCAWPASTYLWTSTFSCGSCSICRLLRTTTSPAAKNFKAISRPIPAKVQHHFLIDMDLCCFSADIVESLLLLRSNLNGGQLKALSELLVKQPAGEEDLARLSFVVLIRSHLFAIRSQ